MFYEIILYLLMHTLFKGDSGAPLVQYVNGRTVLIGIMRATIRDTAECSGRDPMVFTAIQPYVGWIKDTIVNNS